MKLSILICHLHSRAALLKRLMDVLQPQIDAANGEVEVLIEADAGEKTTGDKRNRLLDRAKGDYVAHVDDDDLVTPDYVSRIIAAIDSQPGVDCIGMEGLIYNATPPRRFIHSMKYKSWYEKDSTYYRPENHLNPVRRDLALQVRFPNVVVGEDHSFSCRLLPLLKTEVDLGPPAIYHYYPGGGK